MRSSRIRDFRLGTAGDRLDRLLETGWLEPGEERLLADEGLGVQLSENEVGRSSQGLSLVPNWRVDGLDRLVPMVTEESSVVAGLARVAVLARDGDGVTTTPSERRLAGQILLADVDLAHQRDLSRFLAEIREELSSRLDRAHPALLDAGGGLTDLSVQSGIGNELVLRLSVDVADAQGAAAVNAYCEEAGRWLAERLRGRLVAAVLSNQPYGAPASARVVIPIESLARGGRRGEEVAADLVRMSDWALRDMWRRTTHMKGTLNGVSGLLQAFLQDTRAAAASVMAGSCQPAAVPSWRRRGEHLLGSWSARIPCGIVDRRTRDDARMKLLRRVAGVETGEGLERLAVAVGLMQNLAALHSLVCEGIVRAHGRLHEEAARERG